MSASLRLKGGVLAGALTCLIAGLAVAQQLQQAPGTQPRPGQPGQRDRVTTQPAQQSQQHTAEFRGTQTAGAPASQEIEHYLANCLLIKNKAEVELGQFAQQKAQNPEVKEFAQMLVKDHQQAIQKLQSLAGAGAQGANRTSQRPGANAQFDAQATTPGTDRPRQSQNQDADQSLTSVQPGRQNDALSQLTELDRQISERCQEMVREELQAKSGPEFDMCFVGAQIGSHTHMLAALDVIGQRSQGELRQFVQEAQPVVQRHLDHAKQIAKAQMAQATSRTGAQQAERQSVPGTQRQ